MIRAVLFDFNGVVVDDEPVHFELFQKVAQEEGMSLSREEYYEKYLGMDDHDCFTAVWNQNQKKISETQLKDVIARKAKYYEARMAGDPPFVPGVLNFIQDLEKNHFLAIVSGALRQEVEFLIKKGGVQACFNVLVAAEDVEQGKPNPEGFLRAMALLNRDYVASSERLLPEECLVIEDSRWGLEAAQAAGMPAVGISTTYGEKDLPGSLFCLKDFAGLGAEAFAQKIGDLL